MDDQDVADDIFIAVAGLKLQEGEHNEGNVSRESGLRLAEKVKDDKPACNSLSQTSDDRGAASATEAATCAANGDSVETTSAKQYDCCVCLDGFKLADMIIAPCGDGYCLTCLTAMIDKCITRATLLPLQCHGRQIPLEDVQGSLPPETAVAFKTKLPELLTSTSNRTYCSNNKCSGFLNEDTVNGNHVKCESCSTVTCVRCKGPGHDGSCLENAAGLALVQLAKEEGWQRCPECTAIVELDDGCVHMECLCGEQFCYECGEHWGRCDHE